jgi:predicted transposase/invertase (TIGR01784 family)
MTEIAKFTQEQVLSYEDSLKYYRDLKNSLDTARDEGKIEGKIEGMREGEMKGLVKVAKNMLSNGMPVSEIVKLTGLSESDISNIQ